MANREEDLPAEDTTSGSTMGEPFASDDLPVIAETVMPIRSFALPRTAYLWLAVIVAAYAITFLTDLRHRRPTATKEATLSGLDFTRYVTAETQARLAYALDSMGSKMGIPQSARQIQLLDDALRDFRTLAKDTPSPNMTRRLLILENRRGLPFADKEIISLSDNLKKQGVTASEIADEQRFWQSLYREKAFTGDTDTALQRIRRMKLRFWEAQADADLYRAARQPKVAAQYQAVITRAAEQYAVRALTVNFMILFAALTGIVFFVIYVIAASGKKWYLVRRVATVAQKADWGMLIDAFLFYIAVVRGMGLAVGFLLVSAIAKPTATQEIAFQTIVYIGTGAMALVYLNNRLKHSGSSLADIGLRFTTSGGILAEIGYGVMGYCAMLPMTVTLGLLSRWLLRNNPDTTPNPILPMITTTPSLFWRFVLYILVAVAAPFFEELLFRGALFSGFRKRFSWAVAAALSACCFAVVHPFQDWLPIFGLGLGLAVMREMRQSLVPGMTAHLIQNSLSFIVLSTLFSS